MIDSTGLPMSLAHAFLAAVLGVAVAGCGQKGPLYLRDSPPPNVKVPRPDAYKAVPYPKGAPADVDPDVKPGDAPEK
jgi:predicted small lipoprotein YifL